MHTGEPVSTSCSEYTCGPKLALLILSNGAPLVNATGELVAGRTVLVKGLLIEANAPARINLLVVVALSDGCA